MGEKFDHFNSSTLAGLEENAAVIANGNSDMVVSTKLFVENAHFDMTYVPLKHLGYKTIAVAVADILAMNALPYQVIVNIAISNRFSLEAINELSSGMQLCCSRYNIDLAGLDLSSSQTGLIITITAIGEVADNHLTQCGGAKENELICVTGDLGAAYTGLILLEREKKVFEVNPEEQPKLDEYSYLLERQLKPEARKDIVEKLKAAGIKPTAMMDVSDGLSSELMHICSQSGVGCAIYEDKLPIDYQAAAMAEEMNLNIVTCALNGGEDYELLFTCDLADYEKLVMIEDVYLIGHITKDGTLAGPKVLEHIVDTVLQFEGDQHYGYRIVRCIKNRFGSTSELGIFEMNENGLREVLNPSEILVSQHEEPYSGSAVAAVMEGNRPIMIEVQSLVSSAVYGTPQRSATGFDTRRMNMLLAVLEKRCRFKIGAKDVFLNVAGGIHVEDPAINLAVVAAILSSTADIAIDAKTCFAGELGLNGEVRPVTHIEQRITEANKLGFTRMFVSKYNLKGVKTTGLHIKIYPISRVEEMLGLLFQNE